MELEIQNLSTNRICKTERMGSIYISQCDNFSYKFKEGICFIASEIYEGGWSVTDYLSRTENLEEQDVTLYWDKTLYSIKDIRNNTYYVTDNYGNYERNKFSVEQNLKKAFQTNHLNISYETFVSMCQLKEMGTFDRNINHTGHAFWYYSALLGMAWGKKIITFPWISRQEMGIQSYRFNLLAQVSFELECVIIIPVETKGLRDKNNLPKNPEWFEVIDMKGVRQ